MQKLQVSEQKFLDNAEPQNQNVRLGARLKELQDYDQAQIITSIAAGTTGVITPAAIDADPDLQFDFEVLDVLVRTESAVASSAVQIKNNATAVSDVIISAALNAITHAGTIDPAQNKFYPRSNPAGYAAAKCNIVDSGGATAAKRTVVIIVRRL